jgi:hypothetical protein
MDEGSTGMESQFENGQFSLNWENAGRRLEVTSSLALKEDDEGFSDAVLPLARNSLRESMIFGVKLKSDNDKRVGWIIPANSLASDLHDFAHQEPFLDYAYVAIREILASHQDLFADRALASAVEGIAKVPFSDLFDDNVCFLVVCIELLGEPFDQNRFIPSLVGLGYLPLDVVSPDSMEWKTEEPDQGQKNLRLLMTGPGITNPEVPARLMSLAASSDTSVVTQFFYFYQVVELLLENILIAILPSVGAAVLKSMDEQQTSELKDHLSALNAKMSEQWRLKAMMNSFDDPQVSIAGLVRAATVFLDAMSIKVKSLVVV